MLVSILTVKSRLAHTFFFYIINSKFLSLYGSNISSLSLICIVSFIGIFSSLFVTLDLKTSHKGQFSFEIEIYTSPESWVNMFSINVWFVRIGQYLAEIQPGSKTNFLPPLPIAGDMIKFTGHETLFAQTGSH